jgi:hypothetical protein
MSATHEYSAVQLDQSEAQQQSLSWHSVAASAWNLRFPDMLAEVD